MFFQQPGNDKNDRDCSNGLCLSSLLQHFWTSCILSAPWSQSVSGWVNVYSRLYHTWTTVHTLPVATVLQVAVLGIQYLRDGTVQYACLYSIYIPGTSTPVPTKPVLRSYFVLYDVQCAVFSLTQLRNYSERVQVLLRTTKIRNHDTTCDDCIFVQTGTTAQPQFCTTFSNKSVLLR